MWPALRRAAPISNSGPTLRSQCPRLVSYAPRRRVAQSSARCGGFGFDGIVKQLTGETGDQQG